MAQPVAKRKMTYEEYLAFERASDEKHEFVNGEIFAMTGAKRPHNIAAGNLFASLHAQLRGKPCQPFGSDMRVRSPHGVAMYPDVFVVCGPPAMGDDVDDEITNPVVIVEVLSRSTSRYDRNDKFAHYRTIPSFREYLLVSTEARRIDHYVRLDSGSWTMTSYTEGQSLHLPSIDCTLSIDEVYERFPRESDES
jgi:Uma2 family endonuclease